MLLIIEKTSVENKIDVDNLEKRMSNLKNLIAYEFNGRIKILRRIGKTWNEEEQYGFIDMAYLPESPKYISKDPILSVRKALNKGASPIFFTSLKELFNHYYPHDKTSQEDIKLS